MIERARPRGRRRRGRRPRRAVGVRQVDPARADRRPARAERRHDRGRRRAPAPTERLARCVYMPQRDLLLPWLSALDNAALAPRNRGASRADARGRAAPLFERFGLAGFEASRPERALRRHAPAGRLPAHAAGAQAGAAARRAVRLARRDLPRRDAGVARRGARRAAGDRRCWSPTTSRRRSTCATGWLVLSAPPGDARWRPIVLAEPARDAAARGGHLAGVHRARASARSRRSPGARDEALAAARSRSSSPCSAIWELAARWDLIADALDIKPFLIPAPSDVAESLWDDRSLLADDAWVTVAGGAARVRARARARLLRSPSSCTSPTPCGAPSTRCWSPRRRCR